MDGRQVWRWWCAGLLAALGLLFAASATASSGSAAQSVATYGPAHKFGATQIRSMDPCPPLPVASACGPASPAGNMSSASRASASTLPPDQTLSNEFTFTRWAYVAHAYKIYRRPTNQSRVIAKLQWYTESGYPEIYVLLRSHWATSHQEWIEVRIPGRPNGRTGWVLRQGLGGFNLTHQLLEVNTEQLRMTFYYNGQPIWSKPVGVGKPSTPTPHGNFWITERFVVSDPSSGYYPYAFGTTDYSTLSDWPQGGVVGIHGPYFASWNEIPGRISHGCIRLHVPDDFWLGHHLHLGTPLHVV